MGDKASAGIEADEAEGSLTPRKSPEQGEFRARAASAGQQARAHVSQMVARFRNRSNTTEDKDKRRVRVVGQRVRVATLTQTVLLRINVAIFMTAAGLAGKLEREKEENRRKITSSIGGLDIIR